MPKTDLLQGTLDMLILRTLALGANHGWGISSASSRCRAKSHRQPGLALSALHRLELRGDVESEMKALGEQPTGARLQQAPLPAGRRRLDNGKW